jgi:hypothetical protein
VVEKDWESSTRGGHMGLCVSVGTQRTDPDVGAIGRQP